MLTCFISDEAYHIFSYSTSVASCIANALLIYVLAVKHVQNVGPYRWLLISFALVNVCISLIHTLTLPINYMTEFGFIGLPLRFADMPAAYGVYSMIAWTCFFCQTFALLAYHYVYRFVLVCHPPWLSWLQRNPWRNWIALGVCVDLIFVASIVAVCMLCLWPCDKFRHVFAPMIMKEYNIDLLADNRPGFVALVFWVPLENGESERQTASFLGAVVICFFTFASVSVIVFCIVHIVLASRRSLEQGKVESKTRRMQRQLFRVLMWQTVIPIFTSYVPVAIVVLSPVIFSISLGKWGTVALASIQLLPLIDPLLILAFVPRIRYALPFCGRRRVIGPSTSISERKGDTTPTRKITNTPFSA